MQMEYQSMTNEELEQKINELDTQFKGYQSILTEAYTNMVSLGEEYDKIKAELNKRNNG